MTKISQFASPFGTPAQQFRWRSSGGDFFDPSEMETRHLFYTLRMIWNHSMPEDGRLTPFRPYRFSPFYTAEYMKQAVLALGTELFRRDDLAPDWRAQLDFMAWYLRQNRALLSEAA